MLNIKGKYISLSIMSVITLVVFIMATVFSVTGTLDPKFGMDSALKTAAGLWGVFIILWILNAVMTIPALRWENKSNYLTIVLWINLVLPIFMWIFATIAISAKFHNEETAKLKEVTNG